MDNFIHNCHLCVDGKAPMVLGNAGIMGEEGGVQYTEGGNSPRGFDVCAWAL